MQLLFRSGVSSRRFRLDAVVCMVDSKHIGLHLQLPGVPGPQVSADRVQVHTREAYMQIAYADVVLVNKVDLVTPEQLLAVEAGLRSVNPTTALMRCEHSRVDLSDILGLRCFDVDKVSLLGWRI